jgi:hypothetical protein
LSMRLEIESGMQGHTQRKQNTPLQSQGAMRAPVTERVWARRAHHDFQFSLLLQTSLA